MNKFRDGWIYFPVAIMIIFVLMFGLMVVEDMMVTKECSALSGCEEHKCFQDKSVMIFQQSAAALKYNNCLLEGQIQQELHYLKNN